MKYVDVMNRPRTESLFVEMIQYNVADRYDPVYTMRSYPRDGYPSAYQIYMNSTNEYEAAMKIVGDMRHWRRLCGLKWFMEGSEEKAFEGLKQWRIDKQMKDEAETLVLLKEQAEKGNVTAQKTLLDYISPKKKVGRPNKQKDTSIEAERQASIVALNKRLKNKNK